MSPRLALGAHVLELREGDTLVGSGAQANWRVQNCDLMARHFIVRVAGGVATLLPASGDVVVAVDHDQVLDGGRPLTDGSRIEAGTACFFFWTGAPKAIAVEYPPLPPAHLVSERQGLAWALTRTSTTIGRDPSNVVVVADPTASRFHAEIRREANGYAFHSMGSTGTRINGEELRGPRLLREGDLIEIAFATFRFTGQPVPAELLAPPGPPSAAAVAASRDEPTGQRRRASLPAAGPSREPPRNLGLLLGTTAVIVVTVAALFWLLR